MCITVYNCNYINSATYTHTYIFMLGYHAVTTLLDFKSDRTCKK